MITIKTKLSYSSLETLKKKLELSKINLIKSKNKCTEALVKEAYKLAKRQLRATVGQYSTGSLEKSIQTDIVLQNELYSLASLFTDSYYAFYVEEGTGVKASNKYTSNHRQTPWVYYNKIADTRIRTIGEEGHLFMLFAYSVMESKYIDICEKEVHKCFTKLGM